MAAIAFTAYADLPDSVCEDRIRAARAALKKEVLLLAHHYQRESVYQFADQTGDSLQLSRLAAAATSPHIVFCGVHFMAEVADMLTAPTQKVILPDLAAGCSMADMANLVTVQRAWKELGTVCNPDETIVPITYINSAADLKAFCGEHGGTVCTSTNAREVLAWALKERKKVLFFPDQHLGRNTAYRMGIPLEEMVVWNFTKPMGGLTPEQIEKARIFLWQGHCSVHQVFLTEHIARYKAKFPDANVIAHPECSFEVCEASDSIGSTDFIIQKVKAAKAGTRWLVGTELNLVSRLAKEMAAEGKVVDFMAPMVCNCSTMYRVDVQHLAWALDNLLEGEVVNQIKVPEAVQKQALLALNRMYLIS